MPKNWPTNFSPTSFFKRRRKVQHRILRYRQHLYAINKPPMQTNIKLFAGQSVDYKFFLEAVIEHDLKSENNYWVQAPCGRRSCMLTAFLLQLLTFRSHTQCYGFVTTNLIWVLLPA